MQIRNFLKKEEQQKPIRPPYITKDSDFSLCLECNGDCVDVCETNIIKLDENNSPYLDFSNNGCTFCDECANICEKNVLEIKNKSKIDIIIKINQLSCMSWSKSICFSCKDPCLDNAIKFHGMFYPEIITESCTGCGFCIKYCPCNAIEISFKKES